MSADKVNILIVEDDPIIAEDLKSLLEDEGYNIVAVMHDAVGAINCLGSKRIDFAILDIHLGGGQTGIDVAEIIHDKNNIPYIFLTSFYDDATLSAAKQFAPYGYLVKPFQDRTLLTTINIAMTNFKASQQSGEVSKSHVESKIHTSLTDQEYNVLRALVRGSSYKQIAEAIYISTNTVKYHASNIYRKCDIKSRSELLALIR